MVILYTSATLQWSFVLWHSLKELQKIPPRYIIYIPIIFLLLLLHDKPPYSSPTIFLGHTTAPWCIRIWTQRGIWYKSMLHSRHCIYFWFHSRNAPLILHIKGVHHIWITPLQVAWGEHNWFIIGWIFLYTDHIKATNQVSKYCLKPRLILLPHPDIVSVEYQPLDLI